MSGEDTKQGLFVGCSQAKDQGYIGPFLFYASMGGKLLAAEFLRGNASLSFLKTFKMCPPFLFLNSLK